MSYRKLKIGEDVHEYVIGKTHVKFRGGKVIPKDEIGIKFRDNIIITPMMLRDYFQGSPKGDTVRYFGKCCHDGPYHLGYAPYSVEIEGKYYLVNWCDYCYESNAGDI